MIPYLKKMALVVLICLCLVAGTNAVVPDNTDTGTDSVRCPDSGKVVAPGDTISVTGPSNTQSDLGIQWEYYWTLTSSDGTVIDTKTNVDNPAYSYTVPDTETTTTYKLNLMVTALNDITCVNSNCVSISVNKPSECEITPPDSNTFCTAEASNLRHTYTTGATPMHVQQKWWLLPDPISNPGGVSFNTPNPVGTGNSASIKYSGVTPGKYWVYTGYYAKNAGQTGHDTPLAYCMTPVIVVAVPGNTITVS